ncbi:E3 ubiquitin-protein ligase HERC2, partial [Lachnellula suecica]
MSASSSAASSSLSRSTATVLTLTTLAAAYAAYYVLSSSDSAAQTTPPVATTLRRSNAVRQRRRAATAGLDAPEDEPNNDLPNTDDPSNLFVDNGGENDEVGQLVSRTLADGETVVDDEETYEWAPREPPARNGQNLVQLLFRVSEDATRRNAYVHRGCACNSCGIVPIRGIRYRCANCADYDLCEGCESQGLHTKTHVFYKIRVPGPAYGPRSIQPVWYAGDPDAVTRVLPKEITTKLSRETGFERTELDAYWEQWTFMASTDWRDDPDDIGLAMDRKTFERCLLPSGGSRHTPPSLIFDRMFAFYDTNKDDLIGFSEFLNAIAYRKKKDKWSRIFEGYDVDGDGYVDRKDFLRMFRSYHVLYRQLHQDMLEITEEQQMSCTDAHRLVSGRQPLSSAFGQDGRYPRAPDPRTGEGKSTQPNGDLEIKDGKGILHENSKDRGAREDIFKQNILLLSRFNQIYRDNNEEGGGGYWETIVNPPRSAEQISPIIRAMRRNREFAQRASFAAENMSRNAHPALVTSMAILEDEDNDNTSVESDEISQADPARDDDEDWLPSYATVTDEDAAAIDGPGTRVEDVRPNSRRTVIAHAVYRQRAEEAIHDRWKRRQFYIDEEEGASPPDDWEEHEDILANAEAVGESSKSQSRPSFHSRSSSKVRFAEDMDDFDTRSNPSTSSRSVPERWGGMDIPDAERDAGKEILYQVTQQAFNELLDPLFSEKEDLAMEAAGNKEQRKRWRSEYTSTKFVKWAIEKETKDNMNKEAERNHITQRAEPRPHWPTFPEVEIEEVRERPLEDLLNHTGYSVETRDEEWGAVGGEMPEIEAVPEIDTSQAAETRQSPLTTGDIYQDPDTQESSSVFDWFRSADAIRDPPRRIPASVEDVQSFIAQFEGEQDEVTVAAEASLSETSSANTSPEMVWSTPSSSSSSESYHDPTMPQFRPNATTPTSSQQTSPTPAHNNPSRRTIPLDASTSRDSIERMRRNRVRKGKQPAVAADDDPEAEESSHPSKATLYRYWICDRAAKEAEERGGWGRLSCGEFEEGVRRFNKEVT